MRRLPLVLACWLCVAVGLGCATAAPWPGPVPPAVGADPARVAADVAWLADDAREGRGIGSEGLAAAAAYLAEGFREAGLEPGSPTGPGRAPGDPQARSYLQDFEIPVAIRIAEARLSLGGVAFERGRDFDALLNSADLEGELEVVFAGYGISDEESGWDDYAGLEVEGRAVLVLDARPADDGSPLSGVRGAGFLSRAYKLLNARRHGAAALLLVPSAADVEGLPGGAGAQLANPSTASSGIAAVALSREAATRVLPDLEALQAARDAGAAPAAVRTRARLELAVRVEREQGEVSNVVGVLPGSDPALAGESVVVGAHYDHLGRGEFGSLTPGRRGEIHNGADDNASGSAGLLALARAFAAGPPPRRSLVLVGFTAEEAGLIGSAHYVRQPARGIEDTVAMVNLDMIGRLEDGPLTVFGAETSPRFRSLVEKAAEGAAVEPTFELGANGPSDQTSFHTADVPVLFFFTGTHPQYHTPDDDPERVDAEGTARVLTVVERVTRALLDADERPELVRAAASRSAAPGGGPGYGPYLGTVPAFGGPPVAGVRLSGVTAGSPAERAGLRGGDVIVGYGGAPVRSLEEYAALLFASRAGQRVEITVERDGEQLGFVATLGQRR